jgi:hypothetical protein
MMTSADDIEYFVALCERSNFRSRDEIFDGIRSKKYDLTRYPKKGVPAQSMLEIYRRRLRHIGHFADNSRHAEQMVGDIDAYVSELENAIEDEIKLWRVSVDGMWTYAIFEGTEVGKILGCIRVVDKRTVSDDEWKTLWGEGEP